MHKVAVDGAELMVETFGDPGLPAILLIAGANSSMDGWDPEFCERLAAGPRFVIRYDHRDTGGSTTGTPGQPAYRGADLVDDALRVLDGCGVGTAHLVGVSMGGAIAQVVALDHPDRVASLTLIATTSGTGDDLPPMTEELREYFAELAPPDWADRSAVVEYIVDFQRALTAGPMDEAAVRASAARTVERSSNLEASLTNHNFVEQGEPWRSRLGTLRAPTLVVHGDRDPLFPLGHGRALATEIPGATLLTLPDMGHETPPRSTWDVVVPAVLALTSGGWEQQADRLASRALADGEPTAWFERLYSSAAAGATPMPWDGGPRRQLVEWASRREPGGGRRAVVVGAGLGENAELIAGLGYETLAFDIAPTAVAQARRRFPSSTVDYQVGDLLDLPAGWIGAFDLVVEVYTVQALPDPPRPAAIANVTRLVAPGGTLLVIAVARDDGPVPAGPPWPLTRSEVDTFAANGLEVVHRELLSDDGVPRWRIEFRRPAEDPDRS
jgi:pimeloyl-ACP methyl ester carboxylesterase/SAM-dependent methyltransferase